MSGAGSVGRAVVAATLLAGCTVRSQGTAPSAAGHDEAVPATPASARPRPRPATIGQPSSMRLPVAADDPVWGSPVAPVTLMVFTDLKCPFCARVEGTLEALRRVYGPDNLRIVIKHFPFHEHSEELARVAQGVWLHGGAEAFFGFVRDVFLNQETADDIATLYGLVRKTGVEPELVRKMALDPQVSEKLRADEKLVRALSVRGTPTFFINGSELVGARPLEDFQAVIERELAAARELVASGTAPKLVYATRVGVNAVEASRKAADPEPDVAPGPPDSDGTVIWKVPVAGAPMRGPKDAPITIVEFSDYECPYSRQVQDTVDKLFERYPGQLRLSRRENPLPFHRRAWPAATFALEARAQKGDALYFQAAHSLFLSGLDQAALEDIGKGLGLNVARLKEAMAKDKHRTAIERDQDLAADLGATSTPTFFINGWRLSGAQPLSRFQEVIDAQLKVTEALREKGVPKARLYDEIMKVARVPDPPERLNLPPPGTDLPSRGPSSARVVIEVFGDLQCHFCARSMATLRAVELAFPKDVRFVWRNFPLESIHPQARTAARAISEARAQKGDAKLWSMVELFYRDLEEEDAFSERRLREYAAELGLDADQLVAATRDTRHDDVIDRDISLANKAGITATPTYSIDGFELTGAQPASAFRRLIKYAQKHPRK